MDKLEKDVSGAIVTALFEGGKAGSKSLRDIITAELMKPVTLYVNAVVKDLFGNFGMSTPGGQSPGASGSGGAGILSSIGGSVGGFMAGQGIGNTISNGYGNKSTVNIGAVLGTIFGGPIGGAIGGAIGGVVNRAFGRKLTEQGVQGSYGDSGFEGNSYSFSKGGWLRSNKTTTSEIDSPMQKLLDSSYKGINESMKAVASQFKTEMTGSFAAIKVNLMGLSEADAQAKLSEAIASSTKQALDSIALPGWAKDVVEELGDTFSMEALTSALGGISAMKNALDALGYSSQAWADIAAGSVNELIAEFGSVQVAQQNMSSYYQAYYSEQEQLAFAMSDLNKQLQALRVLPHQV